MAAEVAAALHQLADCPPLQHVRAHDVQGGVDLVAFVLSADLEAAERYVRELCAVVLSGSSGRLTWHLASCAVELFTPLAEVAVGNARGRLPQHDEPNSGNDRPRHGDASQV